MGIMGFVSLKAQSFSPFFQPLTWEQASFVAARDNKLVLVEVGPVEKSLGGKLEKHREMLDYLFRNVIAVRMDLSTSSGKEFEYRLLMHTPPVFAFFMPYGDLVGVVSSEKVEQDAEVLREVLHQARQAALVKKNNSRSVDFASLDLKQALSLAAAEGKSVFVYVREDRNQPSLLMEKNVLNLDRVADFFNQNFVNLSLDKGQADELLPGYPVNCCPTYLFLTSRGKLLYRAEEFCEAEQLTGYGNIALEKAKGIPFEIPGTGETETKARQTGKLIFIDHYVAGNLHKELVQNVFSDPEVTELFTAHFVNIGHETEQAFLQFTDASGKELHRVRSVADAEDLLTQAQRALTGRGVSGMTAEYRQGNRDAEFVKEYMVVLDRAGLAQEASQVAMEYLSPFTPVCLKEKLYWNLFEQYVRSTDASFFDYLLGQESELAGFYGEESVYRKITALWMAGAENFVRDGYFDESGFKEYTKCLKKEKVKNWRQIVRNARMQIAEQMGDWKTFITLAEEKWNEEKLSDAELHRWGIKIDEHCRDEGLRYKMAQWLSGRALQIKYKEQVSGKVNVASYRGFFEKLADDLLKKK